MNRLFTLGIHGRGHATDDLPRAVGANPRVRDPQSVGPDLSACGVRPCCINSIIVHRDVASYLNGELLDRVRLELDAFGDVGSNPIGDVVLPYGR